MTVARYRDLIVGADLKRLLPKKVVAHVGVSVVMSGFMPDEKVK